MPAAGLDRATAYPDPMPDTPAGPQRPDPAAPQATPETKAATADPEPKAQPAKPRQPVALTGCAAAPADDP